MRAAGVNQAGGPVVPLELADPRPLRDGEVLLQVQAAGVGNWDEFVRTGDWDTGARPPMALGVEAAGTVAAVGGAVPGFRLGDRVCTHTLPLPGQGCWAGLFIAAAAQTAPVPPGVPWDVAAAFPVPALTADQALSGALRIRPGETVLVHGGGGVTGACSSSWPRTMARGSSPPAGRPAWTGCVASARPLCWTTTSRAGRARCAR